MTQKREILNALEIAKERHSDQKYINLYDKREVLGIINKQRWKQGASEHEGTFMSEPEFEKIIQKRTFFSTIDKIGIKG